MNYKVTLGTGAAIIFWIGIITISVFATRYAFSTEHMSVSINHSDYYYYQVVKNFSLVPLNSTDCSKIVDPIFYKQPTGIGNNCSYWDKRQLDYYAICVTYEGIVPDLGVTVKDDCGAMSIPVKLR